MRTWDPRPAEVVAGGLTGAALARAEHLIRTDPEYRAELEQVRLAAAAVRAAGAVQPVVPPPLDLQAALAARPARDAGVSGAVPAVRSRRRGVRRRTLTLRPATAALAACALLAAGLGAGAALDGDDGAPAGPGDGRAASVPAGAPGAPAAPGRTVTLAALPGYRGGGRVAVRLPAAAGHTAMLVADGLSPSPAGHYYELWLLSGGRRLASLGSFRVDRRGHAEVRFPVGVDPRAYRYLDVSLEADDGDPGHSAHSVLRSAALS